MHVIFSESWNNFLLLFLHFFNLDMFWVLILQKRIGSRYLVPITPTTVLSRSFWNFTGALRMVWRYACGFFRVLKLFFITGFLLQYLGKWYRTNVHLVNLPIFNSSNKNKAGDINSLWNLLVQLSFCFSFLLNKGMHWFHSNFAELYITIKYRSSSTLVIISQILAELWLFFWLSFCWCVDIGFRSITFAGRHWFYWKFAEGYIIVKYRWSLILVIIHKILAELCPFFDLVFSSPVRSTRRAIVVTPVVCVCVCVPVPVTLC